MGAGGSGGAQEFEKYTETWFPWMGPNYGTLSLKIPVFVQIGYPYFRLNGGGITQESPFATELEGRITSQRSTVSKALHSPHPCLSCLSPS